MKEYGGYLSFDFGEGKEYYDGDDVVALNCARNAIVYSVLDGRFEKIYIPFYMCKVIEETLEKNCINYEKYHINEAFEPINVNLKSRECILYPNYFGLFSDRKIESVINKYVNVILDNTQAFFFRPKLEVYNVYSCRKFIGVTDGAYVVKKGIGHLRYGIDKSYHRIQYLFKSVEMGTNAAYHDNLLVEKELSDSKILEMSFVTHQLLRTVNYDSVIQKRKENFDKLNDMISKIGFTRVDRKEECIPMIYPLWSNNDKMREHLVLNHIYVPYWWQYLLEIPEINKFEKELSTRLLPLPIDQRYNEQDMKAMVEVIENILG